MSVAKKHPKKHSRLGLPNKLVQNTNDKNIKAVKVRTNLKTYISTFFSEP